MINDAPPCPYASKVDSEKSPASFSVARLIARLMFFQQENKNGEKLCQIKTSLYPFVTRKEEK